VTEAEIPQVDLLAAVLERTEDIVRGVRTEQLRLPTPCPKYDVAALLNHLIGWLSMFADAAAGHPHATDPSARQVGDDPAAEFHDAATKAIEAFRARGTDRPIDLGNGPQPGAVVLGMMLIEYIGHGWDLAKATDQRAAYPDAAAEVALTSATAMLKPEYRGEVFGEPVAVPPDASPVDRLVAFIGRDPDWSPR
jgi:uncharacterized protein (TIGR03086 family)